jgi:hypothetical protein
MRVREYSKRAEERNMAWIETERRCVYAARNSAGMYCTVLSVLYVFHFGKKNKTEVALLIL